MSNLVIVAIPDENDRVWKISSEKIPHLTLLFLGDVDEVSNLEQIVQFVEHAASTSLNRFHLPVDRRDELGDDKADVLFFKRGRYDYKAIRDFRVQLLKDDNIRTAYDSAEQHDGVWLPHLTLGYPSKPAKPEPDEWGQFYSVDFNRIAVWVDEYDGPEFLLKDYWDEYEALETVPMDVAMSDIQTLSANEARVALGLDSVEHHGVKGMKWGVRKQGVRGGGSGAHIRISNRTNAASVSGRNIGAVVGLALVMPPLLPLMFLSKRYRAEMDAAGKQNKKVQGDKKFKKAIEKSKQAAKVHNTAAKEINSKLPDFNNDKRWKGIDLTKNPAKQKEYDDAAMKELLNPAYARAAVKVYGSESPTGRYRFEINDASTGTLKFRDTLKEEHDRQLGHAAEDEEEIEVRFSILRNETGHILGFKAEDAEGEMAQAVALGEDFLEHYGVKGMRWGVKKAEVKTSRWDPEGHSLGVDIAKNLLLPAIPVVGSIVAIPSSVRLVRGGYRAGKAKVIDIREKRFAKEANAHKTFEKTHSGAQKDVNDGMSTLNKKYAGKDLNKDSTAKKAYDSETQKVFKDAYSQSAKTAGAKSNQVEVGFPSRNNVEFKVKVQDGGSNSSARRTLTAPDKASSVTKRVINDHNSMTDSEFKTKYSVSKDTYAKRVDKYGDPYMNSPLAKFGKAIPLNKKLDRGLKHADEVTDLDAVGGPETDEDSEEETLVFTATLKHTPTGHVSGFEFDTAEASEMAQAEALSAAFLAHLGLNVKSDILAEGEAFILEHYGVKGMRWGVRREGAVTTQTHIDTGLLRRRTMIEAKGGEAHDAHPDAVKAAIQKRKLKKSGTDALSNQDLQELARRLQLEVQVKTLSTKKGQKFVQKQLEDEGKAQLKRVGAGALRNPRSTVKKVKKGAATVATVAALA